MFSLSDVDVAGRILTNIKIKAMKPRSFAALQPKLGGCSAQGTTGGCAALSLSGLTTRTEPYVWPSAKSSE